MTDPDFEANVEYWFRTIISQVSSPSVVLVGTHMDDVPKTVRSTDAASPLARMEALAKRLLDMAKNAKVSYLAVSMSQSDEMERLVAHLQHALTELPDVGRQIPYSHVFFEQLIKEHAKTVTHPILNQQLIARLGDACGLHSVETVQSCLKLLHDLGSILYFNDVRTLKGLVIVDPLWLFAGLSTIFSRSTALGPAKHGLVDQDAFRVIYHTFPQAVWPKLRTLLIKFEIAHEIEGDANALRILIKKQSGKADNTGSYSGSEAFRFNKRSLREITSRKLKPIEQTYSTSELAEPAWNTANLPDNKELPDEIPDTTLLISALLPSVRTRYW